MSIATRLEELEINLEKINQEGKLFEPVSQVGNLVFTSGQVCTRDGDLLFTGKVGNEIKIEEAQEAARQCIINCLSVIDDHLGSLDSIKKVVKVLGFVQSAENFKDQPTVINAASELLLEVFGDNGAHARSAIGVSELPANTPVEIEIIVEV